MNQPPPYTIQPQIVAAPQPTYPNPGYNMNPPNNPYNNQLSTNTSVIISGQPVASGTTIVQTHRSNSNGCCSGEAPGFNVEAGKKVGLMQFIGGVVVIIVIAISLGVRNFSSYPGIGSSIGGAVIFYIPTGLLGIYTKRKSRCVVVSYLIMGILTAIEAFGLICYEGLAATHFSYDYTCGTHYSYLSACDWEQNGIVVGCHAIACLIALIEFILAIVGSIYCCTGMGDSNRTSPVTMVTYAEQQQMPMVIQTSSTMAVVRNDDRPSGPSEVQGPASQSHEAATSNPDDHGDANHPSTTTTDEADADRSSAQQPTTPRYTGCYFCGEHNHVHRDCHHGQPIRCFSCHKLGHKEKFCQE